MEKNAEKKKTMNLREEVRTDGQKNTSVEFTPGDTRIAYHFKLKDFSSKGFGILVRKDSKVLKYIKEGDVLDMKYHPDQAMVNPVSHQTQIRHITEPGKQQDYMLVGLLILE